MKGKQEKRLFPTIQIIPTELPPQVITVKGLPPLEMKMSIGDESFPEDPLERCHLRWERLFFGVWNALDKHDPKITLGLLEALKQFGLADDNFFYPQIVFEQNPSDEVLQRVSIFERLGHIQKLTGKKLPETRYVPFFALHDYSIALFGLRNFPRRFNNPLHPLKFLKEHISEIRSWMLFDEKVDKEKIPPDDRLKEWTHRRLPKGELIIRPKRELTVRMVAYIHKLKVPSFRKYLTTARQMYPNHARSWKHGLDYTNFMHPQPDMIESP